MTSPSCVLHPAPGALGPAAFLGRSAARASAVAGAPAAAAATLVSGAATARRGRSFRRYSFTLLFPVFVSLLVSTIAYTVAEIASDVPSSDDDSSEASGASSKSRNNESLAPKQPPQPGSGVPVPSVFQVSSKNPPLPVLLPTRARKSAPSIGHRSIITTVPARQTVPTGVSVPPSGAAVVSEGLQPNTFGRVGASFGNVLVLTDVDDTLWCSGSMMAFGKHIGGIDSELTRGLPYPAIGTLLFLLAMGPHTCTPSGLRIPLEHCLVTAFPLHTHNCPYEVQHFPRPSLLPRGAGVLSARASTSPLAQFTRPPSFFKDVEAIFTAGARHIYGVAAPRWPMAYQNEMKFAQVLSSQHSRGAAKVWGFAEAISRGGTAVVLGDTGEKDPEAAAGMAIRHPDALAAVLLHVVFLDRQREVELAAAKTKVDLPKHAIHFEISVAGRKIPATQLVYEVIAKVREGEEVLSPGDLSDETAYAAGMQMAVDIRKLLTAATRQQLLAAEARLKGEPNSLPLPPPLIFLHVTQVHTQVVETPQEASVAAQLASFSSKLATKVSRWSAKKFSQNPELIDIAGFRQVAEVQPVFLQAPLQRLSQQGARYPLGVPFASYRSTVGAALASWTLGMITTQDVLSLVVAAVRDLRSLGPATHCWQRTLVQEMLLDVLAVQHFVGPLESRTDLLDAEVFADAVSALRAFEGFHKGHCGSHENDNATPLETCLDKLERALAQYAANGGPPNAVQQLLPLLSLACRYRGQMEHWLSAGPEEVESFAFLLGRAIILGTPAASIVYKSKEGQEEPSTQQEHAQQQNEQQKTQQQLLLRQPNANAPLSEVALYRLQRDLMLMPELAVDLHIDPDEAPSSIPPSLQLHALDVQTVEDLRPFMQDDYPNGMEAQGGLQQQSESSGRVPSSSRKRDGSVTADPENDAVKDYLGECLHRKSAPVSTWVENLRSFCVNTRDQAGTEACQVLKTWLFGPGNSHGPQVDRGSQRRSRAALPALIRVAEWNTGKPNTTLDIPELSISLEPVHYRPGATGRDELEKAHAFNIVGNVYSARGTVRHQRPSERAAWQRLLSALKVLRDVECKDLFG